MTTSTLTRRIGARRIRILATALVAYGTLGLLLLLAVAIAVGPAVASLDGLARSSSDVERTLAATRDAFDGFGTSLVEGGRAADRASAAARSSAATARRLADAMSVSIFGARPLQPIADDFRRQSQDLDALADELDDVAASLAANEDDVRAIRTELDVLAERAAAIGAAPPITATLTPLAVGLLVWLAAQAVAAIALGIALWRYRQRGPTPTFT